ncbi:MAG TPA: VWA domain-containing protein [Candidatus Sulfopaludibacter sp.]|nr:VWA domain-containing protein [Candidatus Sulfopaludibacter sp.]
MPLRRLSVLLGLAVFLPAQQNIPPNEVTFRASSWAPRAQYVLKTETRLVEVGAVVRDSRGHSVGGLTRDDFVVEDGGKPREITAFTAETASQRTAAAAPPSGPPAPATSTASTRAARYLAILFDDLSMGPGDLIPARIAAKKFLSQGVSPGDLVAIFFLTKGQIVPFTSDMAKLNEALDRLSVATRNASLPTCPNLTAYEAYAISNNRDPTLLPVKVAEAMQCGLCQRRDPRTDRDCPRTIQSLALGAWESVKNNSVIALNSIRNVVDYMATLPGKRVLLMASSGFLSGTLEFEREDIVNHALRGSVVINSLDAKGLYTQDMGITRGGMPVRSMIARQSQGTRPQWESNDTMAVLALSTGGLFFHSNNDLDLGFRELGLLPEYSYSFEFIPRGEPDGKYHTLKVRLKENRGYDVQARPGYFSAAVKPAGPAPAERRIDREMLSTETLDEVPLTFSTEPAATAPGESGLHVVLHLDVAHLQLVHRSGIRTEKLTVIAALFDAAGSFVTGKECEIDFKLKDDTYTKLSTGTTAGLTLRAPPGKYYLRGVVTEANEAKVAASSQPVEVQ